MLNLPTLLQINEGGHQNKWGATKTITHICAAYDITLTIEHLEGKKNVDPDLLSRNLLQEFKKRNPNATKVDVKEWPITPIWP
jgi:hypothetical protein